MHRLCGRTNALRPWEGGTEKRCRSIAAARPGVPSRSNGSPRLESRIASTVSIESGRSGPGTRTPPRPRAKDRACSTSVERDSASLQWRAASISAHNPPAPCIRSSARANIRAPRPNSRLPRNQIASLVWTVHGKGSNILSHPPSSAASSRPLTLRGISSRSTCCNLGSAAAARRHRAPRAALATRQAGSARASVPLCCEQRHPSPGRVQTKRQALRGSATERR